MILITEYNAEDPQTFSLADALPEAVVAYFDAQDSEGEREALYNEAADAMMRHFGDCSEVTL